jgi:Uncharacterized protein conserved in bacteria (DUF2087)
MTERDPIPALRALVVKTGVGLGGLTHAERQLALSVVWAGLPDHVMTEREVNGVLRGLLEASAAFIDIDHVELRRWLVDGGWLARDGYGREYRRVDAAALPPDQAAMAATLPGPDVAVWVAEVQAEHRQRREARRQAHAAGRSGA